MLPDAFLTDRLVQVLEGAEVLEGDTAEACSIPVSNYVGNRTCLKSDPGNDRSEVHSEDGPVVKPLGSMSHSCLELTA